VKPGVKPYGAKLYIQFLAGGIYRLCKTVLCASLFITFFEFFVRILVGKKKPQAVIACGFG
jgi:hypothetical protein